MYVIAAIADVLGLIPVVNVVVDVAAAIALGIWGAEIGVNIYSNKNISKTLLTIGIEAMPIASFVPAWTIRVYFAKKQAREEAEQAALGN